MPAPVLERPLVVKSQPPALDTLFCILQGSYSSSPPQVPRAMAMQTVGFTKCLRCTRHNAGGTDRPGPCPETPQSVDVALGSFFFLGLCSLVPALSDLSGSSVIPDVHLGLELAGQGCACCVWPRGVGVASAPGVGGTALHPKE